MRRGNSLSGNNVSAGKVDELSNSASAGHAAGENATASPVSSRKKGSFFGTLRGTKKKGKSVERIRGQESLVEEIDPQQWEEQKEGDAERIKILNLVKEGKMSIEEAIKHAEELGVTGSGTDDVELDAEEKIFNYGVYKYNKNRTSCSRRILQFDFQEKVLCTIQKGSRGKKFGFSHIRGFDSEDGVRFYIYFEEHYDYELDADTVEEKNKICTLLESIVQQNKADEPDGVFETPVFGDEKVIKEGQVEKKGHSAAFMMWPRRWLRVQQGELLYYKMGEENQTALNIIKLGPGLADAKKLDHSGFIVTTSKKEYSFRVMNLYNAKDMQTVERERDDWIEAIDEGSQLSSRRSRAVSSFLQDPAFASTVQEQEKYIKDVVKTLLRELEQLTSVLTVVNAPIQATVQVKKVQEVVCNMDTQIRTGVLSWAMRELKSRSGSTQDINRTPPGSLPRQLSAKRKGSQTDQAITPIDEGYTWIVPPTRPPKPQGSLRSTGGRDIDGYESVTANEPPPSLDLTQSSAGKCPLSGQMSSQLPTNTTSPATKAPVTPYQTVEIAPSPSRSSSSTPSPERHTGSEELGLYQQPSSKPVMQRRDYRGECYDNVNIKNIPLMAGKASSANVAVVPDAFRTPNQEPKSPSSSSNSRSLSGIPLSEVDAARRSQHEIDAGGMSCETLDKAVKERKELYREKDKGNVVLLSVNKLNDVKEDEVLDTKEQQGMVPVPPTPPPPGGVPPPPPLPISGIPPPPPPGASLVLDSGLPAKEIPKPKRKLRPFFWNKVPVNMVTKSLWLSAHDQTSNLNLQVLEGMFETEDREKPVVQAPSKPTTKMLLDPKKAHNLGIFLSGFKLTAQEIDRKLSLFREEEGAMPVDHVIALKRFLPTPEEQEMYKHIKLENTPTLLPEDQFMMKLCEIADLDKRLDLLLVIMEFPSQFEDLEPAVTSLLEACHELYSSKRFLDVLEYVLAIGNYINAGTNRGGAYGFRLITLTKLVDIRGKNKKDTLLKYLVMQLKQSCPKALEFLADLEAVPKAAGASIKGLSAEVEVMRKDLGKIKKHSSDLFITHKRTQTQDAKFFKDVELFVVEYEEKLKDLCDKCKEMKYIYVKLLSRFGEAPNTDSEELLSSISTFMCQFKKSLNEAQSGRIKLDGLSEAISARAARLSSEDSLSNAPAVSSGTPSSCIGDTVDPGNIENDGQGQTKNDLVNSFEDEACNAIPELKPPSSYTPTSSPKVIQKKLSVKTPSPIPPKKALTTRPTRQGYLEKLSGGKHKAAKWDNRYFELVEGGHLHYYKKPDSKMINTIYLRGCPVEIDVDDPTVITIKTEDRQWNLRAVDSEEATAWKNALGFYKEKQI